MKPEPAKVKEMIFWGATGQAKVLRECLAGCGIALTAVFDNNSMVQPPFRDVPLLYGKAAFETWLKSRAPDEPLGFLVAMGGARGRDRIELHDYLESFGLLPLIARHSTAFVAENAVVQPGCQILAQSAVCVEAVLGRACVINTAASVDHECHLGDGVHIGPGAHLAGLVKVENFATVYSGAVVIPGIRIGEGAVVGAGAVVIEDVPPGTVVVGNPARIIKEKPV